MLKSILKPFLIICCYLQFALAADNSSLKNDVAFITECLVDQVIQVTQDQFDSISKQLQIPLEGYKIVSKSELEHHLSLLPEPTMKSSGSAAANTSVGISSLGGTAGVIGVMASDEYGQIFKADLEKFQINSKCHVLNSSQEGTGSVVVLLITDGHNQGKRTFISYAGVAVPIEESYIDMDFINQHKVLFSEAYLWKDASTKDLLLSIFRNAQSNGLTTALGLANEFVVKHHQQSLCEFITYVDIIFGNVAEYEALLNKSGKDALVKAIRKLDKLAIMTDGSHGSYIITKDKVISLDAPWVESVIDTTGAGDMYAAGFLYGFTHGFDHEQSGKLGRDMAAAIIQSLGARPQESMEFLLKSTQ